MRCIRVGTWSESVTEVQITTLDIDNPPSTHAAFMPTDLPVEHPSTHTKIHRPTGHEGAPVPRKHAASAGTANPGGRRAAAAASTHPSRSLQHTLCFAAKLQPPPQFAVFSTPPRSRPSRPITRRCIRSCTGPSTLSRHTGSIRGVSPGFPVRRVPHTGGLPSGG